jgi:hypothetical protein
MNLSSVLAPAGAGEVLLLSQSAAYSFPFLRGQVCLPPFPTACTSEVLEVEETVARASRWDAAPDRLADSPLESLAGSRPPSVPGPARRSPS